MDLLKCFWTFPCPAENNPVDLKWIHNQQNIGTELATKTAKYPNLYFSNLIDDGVIVCHALPNEDFLMQWKILLTKEMVISLIYWYHLTIQTKNYHPDIRKKVDNFPENIANV